MPSRIGDALRWYATYTPTKTAIISAQGEQSYAQLWTRVRRLANSLTKLGINPDDRKRAYSAAIKIMTEKMYLLPLFNSVVTYGYSKDLNFKPWPDELPRFYLSSWK